MQRIVTFMILSTPCDTINLQIELYVKTNSTDLQTYLSDSPACNISFVISILLE